MRVFPFLFLFVTFSLSAQPTTWNSSTTYSVGDLVISGTSSYSILSNSGKQPPNLQYWNDLSNIHPTNPPTGGDNNSPVSTWQSQTSYSAGSIVIHEELTYFAIQDVPPNIQPPNATYWMATAPIIPNHSFLEESVNIE